MNNFYIYGHYTADTNELFYIGKGKETRAESSESRNKFWHNVVKKHGLIVKILYENLSEDIAFVKEKELIMEYGRRDINTGILVNQTNGGQGTSGHHFEQRSNNPLWKEKNKLAVKKMRDALTYDDVWKTNNKRAITAMQTDEVKAKCKRAIQARFADPSYNNPRKKTYDGVVSPEGIIYHPIIGLSTFAIKHGLAGRSLWRVITGLQPQHRGWKKYIPPDDNHLLNQFTL
jgi:hypothetical protein